MDVETGEQQRRIGVKPETTWLFPGFFVSDVVLCCMFYYTTYNIIQNGVENHGNN